MIKLLIIYILIVYSIFSNEGLFQAVENNNIKEVEVLLKKNIDINAKEQWFGKTALMIAASHNYWEIVDKLLKEGANPEIQTSSGDTALLLAYNNKAYKSFEILIEKKQNLNLKNADGNSILHLVARDNKEDYLKKLLDKGQIQIFKIKMVTVP